jgi:hypothetical protein
MLVQGGVSNIWGNATISFTNTIIVNASSAGDGGALLVENAATANFTGCAITGCFAAVSGGAIAVRHQGQARLARCLLSNCAAVDAGTIDATNNASVILEQCQLQHNTASRVGGAVAVHAAAQLNAAETRFLHNAASIGGAISVSDTATVDGIYIADTTTRGPLLTLFDCVVYANKAQHGGGIALGGTAALQMSNTTVSGNIAGMSGGGVHLSSNGFNPSQLRASVVDNKAPLGANVDVMPVKLIANSSTTISGFVSRLGGDEGILNVSLQALGPHDLPAAGMDVVAIIVFARTNKFDTLSNGQTDDSGFAHLKVKLRKPPGEVFLQQAARYHACAPSTVHL